MTPPSTLNNKVNQAKPKEEPPMILRPSRRAVIQGSAAIASLAALGTRWLTDPVFAAGKTPVLRYNRDLQTLDPPNRVGPLEEMIYNCCSQNLARF